MVVKKKLILFVYYTGMFMLKIENAEIFQMYSSGEEYEKFNWNTTTNEKIGDVSKLSSV